MSQGGDYRMARAQATTSDMGILNLAWHAVMYRLVMNRCENR